MAPKTLLLLSILAVIFMIAYAGEAARDVTMHSGDAENVGKFFLYALSPSRINSHVDSEI